MKKLRVRWEPELSQDKDAIDFNKTIYTKVEEKRNIEGYWYSDNINNKEYPMPEPNILTESESKEIYDLITEKEKTARNMAYMGWTTSRITNEILGSTEWETGEWIWPEDFGKHYVLEHKVKPSDEFLKYIGYSEK